MAAVHAPVHTRCHSQVSGTAALLLASGLRGHRSLAELGVVAMVPLAPGRNPHLTLKMAQETFERLTTAFVEAFTTATGRAPGEIREAMATHHSFMGSTARDFGFVDLLMTSSLPSP